MRYFLLFTQIFSATIFLSQNFIKGKVIDKSNKESIVGAIVRVDATNKAVLTDIDGNFELKDLSETSYNLEISYVSYVTKKLSGVNASTNPIAIEIGLEPEGGKDLKEVTVSQTKIQNTETSVVMEMKKNTSIISAVSAAQISKSQDRDASEVIRRVPGVSILNNRFIMVRGLSDRYNTVWMNDAGAPSVEPDKKSFSFDMVSSNLIERMLVYKTASPELPGDFAGGMVKIYTSAMPEKTGINVQYQTGFRQGTTGQNYYHTAIYKKDWLGMGAADRELPAPKYIHNPIKDYAQSLPIDWILQQSKARPDQRVNVTLNGLVKTDKYKFGSVTGINYANTFLTTNRTRQFWDSTAQQQNFSDLQSSNSVRLTGIQNFAFVYLNHKLELRNFFNQQGNSQTIQRYSNRVEVPNQKAYAFEYNNRTSYSSQLSGSHSFFKDLTEITWTGGLAMNRSNIPDRRITRYTKQQTDPDSLYYMPVPRGTADPLAGGRYFSKLKENIYSFNLNLKQILSISNYTCEFNAGTYLENKYRELHNRSLGYIITRNINNAQWNYYSLDSIFNANHVGIPTGFNLDEITNPYDTYAARNNLRALYISGNFPIGKHIRLQGGLRNEHNIQSLQSYINTDSISPSITTNFYLPSFNGSYSFNEKHILRTSYSKTLNRPEFREWAPLYYYDFEENAGTSGSLFPSNPRPNGDTLKVCEITNYDVRYEFYPSYGEYIQIGAFYKTFIHPIQRVINIAGEDSRSYTFVNADNAYVQGVELDVRKKFDFFDKWFGINFFSNLSFVGNASVMKSLQKINVSKNINELSSSAMPGQSPYLINAGLYYQNDSSGTQLSLLYNTFGNRIIMVGSRDVGAFGEISRHSLDFTMSQRIYKGFSFTFAVQNILNSPFRIYQDNDRDGKFNPKGNDGLNTYFKTGVYYSFGLRMIL